jgi:hypothetical protein
MTREQMTCEHSWRKTNGGYCSECFLTRKAEREWISEFEASLPTDQFMPEAIKKHIENLKLKFVYPPPPPPLTEIQLGLPPSYKGYQPEAYLIGEPTAKPKFKTNGHT